MKTNPLKSWIGALGIGLTCVMGQAAPAATLYSYEGFGFSDVFDEGVPGAFTGRDRITGSLTLADQLPDSSASGNLSAQVLAFSFTDGRTEFSSTNGASLTNLFLRISSFGNVAEWDLRITKGDPYNLFARGDRFSELSSSRNNASFPSFGIDRAVIQECVLDRCDPHGQNGIEQDLAFRWQRYGAGRWTIEPAPVPLPASGLLILGGLAGLSVLRARSKAA